MKQRAFTLIELLTVIAIIAIIAGLIFPALATAKQKAKRTACQNNLHQVYLTMQYFANDHDGDVPIGYRGGRKQWDTMFFSGTVNKFVTFGALYTAGLIDQPRVFYCPAELASSQSFNTTDNPWPPGITGTNLQCGYASNPIVDWGTNDVPPYWPQMDQLGSIAFLSDSIGLPDRVDSRHRTGVNVIYTDGSAAWVQRPAFDADLSLCTTIVSANNDAQDRIWQTLSQR